MISNLFGLIKKPLLGIDICMNSVNLIELTGDNTGDNSHYQLNAFAVEPLPPLAVIEKNINDVHLVANTIRKAVAAMHTKCQNAAVAVSGPTVIIRLIQMPKAFNEDEILEQIELESDRYIPYPLEEVYFDFDILGPAKNNYHDIVLGAAKIDTVESYTETLYQAGLKATIVDIEAFAMERTFKLMLKQLPKDASHHSVALFDFGATMTLYVFKNARSIYMRDQGFGLKQLLGEIERRYGMSAVEAGLALKWGRLPGDYEKEVLFPFTETLLQQMSRGLQTFYSSTQESDLKYLVFSGSGLNAIRCVTEVNEVNEISGGERRISAESSRFAEMLSHKLNIKSYIINPFAAMRISPKVNHLKLMEESQSLMLALGLALRSFDESTFND